MEDSLKETKVCLKKVLLKFYSVSKKYGSLVHILTMFWKSFTQICAGNTV